MTTRFGFFKLSIVLFLIFVFSSFSQKNTINVKIDGMMCQAGCAMYIENELEGMKGVVEASIDFNKSVGEITLKKRKSSSEKAVVEFINDLKGGAYKASIIDNATNQIKLNKGAKSCSKGSSCCQKTGKKVVTCDNKSKGCCSGGKTKKVINKENSISESVPGHTGCRKACCANK